MKIPEPRKLSSGNWFIQLRLGGESIPITEPTEKKCVTSARLAKAEYLAGKRNKGGMVEKTLKDACTEYIENRRSRLSPSTIQGYEKIRDNNFQSIMSKQLDSLTWRVLDEAIGKECARKSARGKPLTAKSVNNAFLLILSVLKYNKIKFDDSFSLPEIKRKPVQIIPAEDVYRAVKGTEIELPCLLSMWLTMSLSEIRGLTKSKSIRNNQIAIVETVIDTKDGPVRKEGGKEVERTRIQNLPPYIKQLIEKVDGDIICALKAEAINRRLKLLLSKNGLSEINFHKLRHISASTMAALNIPANYAQEKGGWKTDYTMQTVYTHTFTEERKQADAKMDGYFEDFINIANKNANE